jgi:hypothetical protein
MFDSNMLAIAVEDNAMAPSVDRQFLQSARCRECLLRSANAQGEQLADVEEKLADVEEATEERMHSVADLVPEKSEEIH